MNTFKYEGPGIYLTRAGEFAVVTGTDGRLCISGRIPGDAQYDKHTISAWYKDTGVMMSGKKTPRDLIALIYPMRSTRIDAD